MSGTNHNSTYYDMPEEESLQSTLNSTTQTNTTTPNPTFTISTPNARARSISQNLEDGQLYLNFNNLGVRERNAARQGNFRYIDATTGNVVESGPMNRRQFRNLWKQQRNAAKLMARRADAVGDNAYFERWQNPNLNIRDTFRQMQADKKNNWISVTPVAPKAAPSPSALAQTPKDTQIESPVSLYQSRFNKLNDFWRDRANQIMNDSTFIKNYDSNNDGKIDVDEFYAAQSGLGDGDTFNDGKFGNKTLNALLSNNGISLELYNQLYKKPQTNTSTTPEITETESTDDYPITQSLSWSYNAPVGNSLNAAANRLYAIHRNNGYVVLSNLKRPEDKKLSSDLPWHNTPWYNYNTLVTQPKRTDKGGGEHKENEISNSARWLLLFYPKNKK